MDSTPTSRLDFGTFYLMEEPFASRPMRVGPPGGTTDTIVWQYAKGQSPAGQPMRMRQKMGGKPADFIWTTFMPLLCVQQRVIDLLQQHKFTGWSTYLVELTDRKGETVDDYVGLAVTGPQLERDIAASTLEDRPAPVPQGKPYQVYVGYYFPPEQWDGSDFFWVRGGRIVTESVVQAFKRAKVTNIRFSALPTIETDAFIERQRNSSE